MNAANFDDAGTTALVTDLCEVTRLTLNYLGSNERSIESRKVMTVAHESITEWNL